VSDEQQIEVLEEKFYVAEYGFSFVVKTGIDLTNMVEGDLKGVLQRADGSVALKNIPLANISEVATGTVLFPVSDTDFTVPGRYVAQVFVKDTSLGVARPSHPFGFDVERPIGGNSIFPWA
jgi:hypothetical protein